MTSSTSSVTSNFCSTRSRFASASSGRCSLTNSSPGSIRFFASVIDVASSVTSGPTSSSASSKFSSCTSCSNILSKKSDADRLAPPSNGTSFAISISSPNMSSAISFAFSNSSLSNAFSSIGSLLSTAFSTSCSNSLSATSSCSFSINASLTNESSSIGSVIGVSSILLVNSSTCCFLFASIRASSRLCCFSRSSCAKNCFASSLSS